MKVSVESKELIFKPTTINIVLETKSELERFYSIFNHSKIISALDMLEEAGDIRVQLLNAFGTQINSTVYLEKINTEFRP